MRHLYFAYGANTNHYGMNYRCPTAKCLGVATLTGYSLRFRYHADIQTSKSGMIEGVLWEISENDLETLDYFEGYPTYYTRKPVTVLHGDTEVTALVYMMIDQSYEYPPTDEYLAVCIDGYMENGVDLHQIEESLNYKVIIQ